MNLKTIKPLNMHNILGREISAGEAMSYLIDFHVYLEILEKKNNVYTFEKVVNEFSKMTMILHRVYEDGQKMEELVKHYISLQERIEIQKRKCNKLQSCIHKVLAFLKGIKIIFKITFKN